EMAGTRDRTFTVVQYRVSRPTVAVDAAPATIPGEPCLVVAGQLPQQLARLLQLAGDAGDLPDDLLKRFASQAVGAEAQGDRPALDALHAVQFLSRHRSPPYPGRGRGGRNTDRIRGPHNPWRSGPCPSASSRRRGTARSRSQPHAPAPPAADGSPPSPPPARGRGGRCIRSQSGRATEAARAGCYERNGSAAGRER